MSAAPVVPPARDRVPQARPRLVAVAPLVARDAAPGAVPARLRERPGGGGGPDAMLAPTSRAQAWRRRVVAALVLASLVVVVVAALVALLGQPAADGPRLVPVAATTVVAEPGDTLWEIARVHGPEGMDTREYVGLLREHNGLQDTMLQAWQVIELPGV